MMLVLAMRMCLVGICAAPRNGYHRPIIVSKLMVAMG